MHFFWHSVLEILVYYQPGPLCLGHGKEQLQGQGGTAVLISWSSDPCVAERGRAG